VEIAVPQASKTTSRRAIVIGGSVAGLFAAIFLRQSGWSVDVYEKSKTDLSGRGAGITSHPELLDALAASGVGADDLGIVVDRRITMDGNADVVSEMELPQLHTSWDRIYQLLLKKIPSQHYHLDRGFLHADQNHDGVVVHFADGTTAAAELVVGADGFRSAVREQCAPDVQPIYSGYVVWRGTPIESRLLPKTLLDVFPYFAFYFPKEQQIMGYPIAGLNNDLRPGHRRYNFVWYRVVDDRHLRDMCTDEDGRIHDFSIAPPLIRRDVIAKMRADAAVLMPPPFLDVINNIEAPFFTPIYDFISPKMVFGRIALVGDAASVGRPHTGYGVTKAACDALALARSLDRDVNDFAAGLAEFEAERLAVNRRVVRQGRLIGTNLIVNASNQEEAKTANLPDASGMMRFIAMPNFLRGEAAIARST
jgi:2-polyprenyl-6-methoxyphenol hydroxylase-like FAD-dependent oxidoreductase